MLIDSEKLTAFTICEEKEIVFDINGKKIVFAVPFLLKVSKDEKKLLIGRSHDKEIKLTDDDVQTIFNDNDEKIVSACEDFIWSMFLRNMYCKK